MSDTRRWIASAHVILTVEAADEEAARTHVRSVLERAGLRLGPPGSGPNLSVGSIRLDVPLSERTRPDAPA